MPILTSGAGLWRMLAAALMLLPAPAAAQASPNVPIDDPAYSDVDRLVREGVLDSVVVGHRPFTRGEFLRLARLAGQRLAPARGSDGLDSAGGHAVEWPQFDMVSRVVRRLEQRFGGASRVALDELTADVIALDSDARGIPDNGLGVGVVTLNPLVEGLRGRPITNGSTMSATVGARLQLGALAGAVSIRRTLHLARNGSRNSMTDVERLYVTLAVGNLLLQAGRDALVLGSGSSGLLVSANAPALDMIKLSTARPFLMPSLLRRLGPGRVTVFATDLGGGRMPNHDWLAGYRVSILPHRNLELGVTVGSQQGGSGSVEASAVERVVDLFPLVDVLFMQDRDLEISNKYSGIDFRWRLPHLGAIELYGDLLLDDFDHRRLVGTFRDDAAVIAGITLPRLSPDGRWQGNAEYHRTGLRFYTHGQFRHGLTRRGFILGNPLGPDGDAGRLQIRYARDMERDMTLELVHERRSGDRYTATGGYGGETLRFIRIEDLPTETRTRATLRVTGPAIRGWTRAVGEAGVEQVRSFGFGSGDNRMGTVARFGLEARF